MNRRRFLLNGTGAMGLLAGGSSPVSLADNSERTANAGSDNQPKAKLSLSTDFANPAHWDRVIEFASKHEVARLVYWGFDSFESHGIFLYPRRPKLLPEQFREQVERERGLLRSAAAKTTRAGITTAIRPEISGGDAACSTRLLVCQNLPRATSR